MALETIVGDLRAYSELEPGTFLHGDQLTAEQVHDTSLRRQAFYVADGPLYSLEGKKRTPTLFLTLEPDNLVLRHLNDEVNSSFDQLVKTGNFRPGTEEARKAMEAKDTLRIDLTKLRLKGDNAEWRYVEISTTDYDRLNAEERKLAERFYGQGTGFVAAMKALQDEGISNTRVYVLNPDYVRKEAVAGPVARAAWRGNFDGGAGSDAGGHDVDILSGLRGVRRASEASRKAPEGRAAPKEGTATPVAPSFEQVLAYSAGFVPESVREQYEIGLRNLFKR